MPPERPEMPEEPAVSLEALRAAYAEALGKAAGREPPWRAGGEASRDNGSGDTKGALSIERGAESLPPAIEGGEELAHAAGEAASEIDPCPVNPLTILEALLFVGCPGDEPLRPERAAQLMRGVGPEEIPDLAAELNRRYAAGGCPYHVVLEGAGYRLRLRPEFAGLRDRVLGRSRQARLSQAAVETLAIVAYRQPISAEEVNRLRGVPSGAVLSHLVRRRLLRLERPAHAPRKAFYRTTERFLELFGLKTLADLPQSEDVG